MSKEEKGIGALYVFAGTRPRVTSGPSNLPLVQWRNDGDGPKSWELSVAGAITQQQSESRVERIRDPMWYTH